MIDDGYKDVTVGPSIGAADVPGRRDYHNTPTDNTSYYGQSYSWCIYIYIYNKIEVWWVHIANKLSLLHLQDFLLLRATLIILQRHVCKSFSCMAVHWSWYYTFTAFLVGAPRYSEDNPVGYVSKNNYTEV